MKTYAVDWTFGGTEYILAASPQEAREKFHKLSHYDVLRESYLAADEGLDIISIEAAT